MARSRRNVAEVVGDASPVIPSTGEFEVIAERNELGLLTSPQRARIPMTILRQTVVIEAVRRGHTVDVASAMAEIPASTVRGWLHKGRDEPADNVYGKFYMEYRRAEGVAQEILIDKIVESGRNDWRSFAWLLARRYSDWSDTVRPSVDQQREMHHLKVEKARAEIAYIKARTDNLVSSDGDPVQELLDILAADRD